LRLTVSQPVRLGSWPPFGTLDQMLSCSSFQSDNYCILRSKAPSLTRKRVCSLQCNHSLVRSLTSNHILPPHLRLCSLFVASYDSQGLRWKYSNPPPHGVHRKTSDNSFIYLGYIYCSWNIIVSEYVVIINNIFLNNNAISHFLCVIVVCSACCSLYGADVNVSTGRTGLSL
jgi:hypothetical protein